MFSLKRYFIRSITIKHQFTIEKSSYTVFRYEAKHLYNLEVDHSIVLYFVAVIHLRDHLDYIYFPDFLSFGIIKHT